MEMGPRGAGLGRYGGSLEVSGSYVGWLGWGEIIKGT